MNQDHLEEIMKRNILSVLTICAAALIFVVPCAIAQGHPISTPTPPPALNSGEAASNTGMAVPAVEKSAPTVLRRNPGLAQELRPLLPSDITPQQAAVGFYDINHFVAAVHVSHDLSIPFTDLRCTELGGKYCSPETKAKSRSLESAILSLKPGMSKSAAKTATKTAEHESKAELKNVNTY
jgi:hypothetical protein